MNEEIERAARRAEELGQRFMELAGEGGYGPIEVAAAAASVHGAAMKVALLCAILGEDAAARVADMLAEEQDPAGMVEELIREAEGVLEDVDK